MIKPSEAERIQQRVAESFDDRAGLRSKADLEWVLARPFALNNGIPAYPTFFNKLSALVQGMLERRPFVGANRRTALCLAALLLREKGYKLRFTQDELDRLIKGVELGFTSTHRIAIWIKSHTVREARRA